VDQDAPGCLVRITVEWRQRPNGHSPEEHWTASVFRTADGTRVALVGGVEGTIEAVVDGVVKTFLEGTQQGE